MLKRLLRRPGTQAAMARLVGAYLDFALRTTRWTLHGAEHLAPTVRGQPTVVAFWHERLPLMAMLWVEARRRGSTAQTHILASRHHDGRFIGEIMRRFQVEVAHGSSAKPAASGTRPGAGRDKGGSAGARALVAALRAGHHVVITPDGPRGPRRRAAPGVAQIAALAGAPVLPAAAQTSARRVLRTWDRMVLPLPFGRGVLVCGAPVAVPRETWESRLPAIEAALTGVADLADRLCAA